MANLNIYKASAGSGKTFTLAVEYIKLLIQNPTAYRNILAVTFTNKATTEMKERILTQLYGISKGDAGSKAYLDKICTELGMDADAVRKGAKKALFCLIHDYSHFQVTTIDSFFQTVVRGLARELDLGTSMNIELDTLGVLSSAVDELVGKLDANSPVFIHLLAYIRELISEDRTWKIIDSIKEFGKNIFNEEFLRRRESLREKLNNPLFIHTYKRLLQETSRKAEAPLKEIVDRFFSRLEQVGLDHTAFKGKDRGIGSYFKKLRDRRYSDDNIRNATVEKCLADIEAWRGKDASPLLTDEFVEQMRLLLVRAEEIRPEIARTINSCTLSLEDIDKVGLLADIDREVREQNWRKNRFLLAETNILLHKMMQEESNPSFVFEKIGANVRHVMIDEFQDTSRLQWNNFRTLLLEGLSQDADSLIVGDVKQAIYRWRNGDWSILNNDLRKTIGTFPIVEKSLTTNRRSEEEVILFNNHFFTSAVQELNERHKEEQHTDCHSLIEAYADVCQEFPDNKQKGHGYVKVSFPDGADGQSYEEATLEALADEVSALLEQGVRPEDIAILVRKNKYIPLIADYFEAVLPQVTVVSNEAYRFDASSALVTLIQSLRVLARPDDMIARAHLAAICHTGEEPFQWNRHDISSSDKLLPAGFIDGIEQLRLLPLYELLERLVALFGLHRLKGQEAYLLAFFDAVAEYLKLGSADYDSFLHYWDERLCSKTIPAGNVDGLHIYSIHNSKGLEFHTVLVPFCCWNMENEQPVQSVWCTAPEQPYDHVDLLPIRYGKSMDKSVYHDAFLKERLELWVDNLNILYVAFTRATANLIVMGRRKERGFGISTLMQAALRRMAGQYDADTPYEQGCMAVPKQKEERTVTNLLQQQAVNLPVRFESYGRTLEFRQSNSSAAFVSDEADGDEGGNREQLYLSRGRLLHHIIAAIRTADDVGPILQRMEMEGLFNSQLPVDDVRSIIARVLGHPQGADWFTAKWRLFNECAIICRDEVGKTVLHRPDRVMTDADGKQVIVVDFKFGKPRPQYTDQVQEYMQLLSRMGYPQVKGYLWYVYSGRIEEVFFS